jgi:hypothetical protein
MTEHENTIPVWRYDVTETNFPCGCCSPTLAMEGGLWTCQRKTSSSSYKSWFVIDDEVDLTQPHDVRMCNGTCTDIYHQQYYQLAQCEMNGETWGDLMQTWNEERKAMMTQEEKIALVEQERAADAETNRLAPLIQFRKFIMQKAEQKALSSRYGCNKGRKENKPCPDLYTPDHRHPTTLGVSSECWAHEVTDPMTYEFINPKTKEFLPLAESYGIKEHMKSKKSTVKQNMNGEWVLVHVVHVCWNQHPGDAGWKEQWMTDYRYKEPVVGGDGVDGTNWFQANTNPIRTQNRTSNYTNKGSPQGNKRR